VERRASGFFTEAPPLARNALNHFLPANLNACGQWGAMLSSMPNSMPGIIIYRMAFLLLFQLPGLRADALLELT
ncbi:MAG: hypothetical protein ACXVJ1_08175, partial [Candidatus Angelobacter sp.]